MVHKTDLDAAIAEGARPATEREWTEAKLGKAGEVAAAGIGAGQGATFGYGLPAVSGGLHAVGADATADDIVRGVRIAKDASPNAYLGGEVAGALAPMALGAPPGEAGAALAEGFGARALQRAVAAAPRAVLEGGAIAVGGQATKDTLANRDFDASAYLTAAGEGGALGLVLGTGASAGLGALGDRAAVRAASRGASRPAIDAAEVGAVDAALVEPGVTSARSSARINIDQDAGLFEKAGAVEKPFVFGKRGRAVSLDNAALESEFASGVSGGAPPIRARGYADAAIPDPSSPAAKDFYLRGHDIAGPAEEAEPFFKIGKLPRVRGEEDALLGEATSPVWAKKPVVERGMTPATEKAPFDIRLGIDPNAALEGEQGAARDVFSLSRAKNGGVPVRLGDVGPEGVIPGKAPLRIGPLTEPSPAAVEEIAAKEGQRGAAEWLQAQAEKHANRQAFKATGAKGPDVRRLEDGVAAQQAEMDRLGARLRNEKVDGKPLIGPLESQAEIAKNIETRWNEVGKDLGQMRGDLDKAAVRPSLDNIVSEFETQVGRPADKMPLGEADVAAARKYLEDMVAKGGARPTFEKLYTFRRRLDDKLHGEYARAPNLPSAQGADAMHALRGIIEGEYTRAAEQAANEVGETFAAKYKTAKELYADLSTLRKISKAEAERNGGANWISITDVIAGFATGGLPGVAAVAGNQIRRKFGNQILSYGLGEASNVLKVQNAAMKLDTALNKGARAALEGGGVARPVKKITDAEIRSVRDAVNTSPEALQAKLSAGLADMVKYDPELAAATGTRAVLIATYLRGSIPKDPAPVGFGRPRQREFTDEERIVIGQKIEVAEDPSIVVDRLLDGRLSRTHIEAMKATHPEAYTKLVDYMIRHRDELRPKLDPQQLAAISILFGFPMSEEYQPEIIRMFQSTVVDGSQAPKADGTSGGAGLPVRPVEKVGGSIGTALNKLEAGKDS